jgi:sterol 3beta-glucosyltransferase
MALKQQGKQVTLIVADSYRKFVEGYGIETRESRVDLPWLLTESDIGKRFKTAGMFEAISLIKELFGPVLNELFEDTLKVCQELKPQLLILTTFPAFAGCHAIAKLVPGIKIMFAHTIPASPTREFAPSTAGAGFTSRFGLVNQLYWTLGDSFVNAKVYGPIVGEIFKKNGYNGDIAKEIGFAAPRNMGIPVDYVYSNALLPKPADWMANEYVTGFLDLPAEEYTPPPALQAFVNGGLPLVYVGLGSMLGVLFDTPEDQIKQLNVFAQGYNLMKKKCRMILHCTTGGGKFQHPTISMDKDLVYLLDHSVPHTWLFPKCDLIVHHGGAGSTQTSLFYGKPTLIFAGTNNADQPFWGDLVTRRQLGPKSKLLSKLTPEKFASKCEDGLFTNAELYKKNAAALGKEMAAEDGRKQFVDLCLATLSAPQSW